MGKDIPGELTDWFRILFDRSFKEKIKQEGIIKSWIAMVDSYDPVSKKANVHLPNDEIHIIPDIKNKSGEELFSGDTVELHSRLSTLGNSYIAVKY